MAMTNKPSISTDVTFCKEDGQRWRDVRSLSWHEGMVTTKSLARVKIEKMRRRIGLPTYSLPSLSRSDGNRRIWIVDENQFNILKYQKKKTVERSAVLFLFQSNILKSNGFEKVLITIIKPRKTFRFYNGTWNQFKIDWASLCYLALPCKHSMKSCFHLSITSRWSIKMLSIS